MACRNEATRARLRAWWCCHSAERARKCKAPPDGVTATWTVARRVAAKRQQFYELYGPDAVPADLGALCARADTLRLRLASVEWVPA